MKVHRVGMGGMDRQKFCNCRLVGSHFLGCLDVAAHPTSDENDFSLGGDDIGTWA